MTAPHPDVEAMLVALVLAPSTYSRNRFYDLYREPSVRRARRRAATIRSIVRHVVDAREDRRGEITALLPLEGGRVELTYVVPALGLKRTTTLEPLEMALLRFAVGRSRADAPLALPLGDEPERWRIEEALRRLLVSTPPAVEESCESAS